MKRLLQSPLPSFIIFTWFFFQCTAFSTRADVIVTAGTTLKVLAGTSIVAADNLDVKSTAVLDNSGTIILKKNLTNENSAPNTLGSGLIELSGSVSQTLNGQNIIQNLKTNNATGIILGGNTIVNGTLTLTNGTITLGNNNLQLGPSAVISGTPSASVMIIVTSSGELRKEFPQGFTGSFTYPVGDATGTQEYSPVTLTFLSGEFVSGNYIGVSLVNSKYPDPNITGNYLNRFWKLSQSGISNFLSNASFTYLPADVTGTENLISCTKVNPLPWTTYSMTNASTHVLSASGISSFSSFTGLKSSTPPQNQELINIITSNGTITCYDAVQVLTLAGNGSTFLVENGGSVTLIAGIRISLLAGTKVNTGGYMLAKISMDFCSSQLNPLVMNPTNTDNKISPEPQPDDLPWIKIYPNPTDDIVFLEFSQNGNPLSASLTILNMQGQTVSKQVLHDEGKYRLSLSGLPVGVYVIHVNSESRTAIAKIVKK